MDRVFDVVIIGGGINGCGCAADAASRGLSVLLCEQDDLASKTSSSSTKLIHGGLRYLENFDFSLVKKALNERNTLQNLAPHLVYPIPFVLPQQAHMRPSWLLRSGLFLYDHLSRKNKLPKSKLITCSEYANYFMPLVDSLKQGFLFYDCATDDARLTLVNALQAKEFGAEILTQTRLIEAQVDNNLWRLTLKPSHSAAIHVSAKAVINAAGPWIAPVSHLLETPLIHAITLVKGSHMVVEKLYEGEHAYLLQHDDKRIVFVIPYHGYTLIGTTDVDCPGNLENLCIEQKEIDYLCLLVNKYFKKELHPRQIIHCWSGVRPLLSEPGKPLKAISRDYAYHFSKQPAPAITIYSGKITTYRQLAAQAINQLLHVFPNLPASQTEVLSLPGSVLGNMSFYDYKQYAHEKYRWLDKETLARYLNNYGTRTELILAGCKEVADLGLYFSPTLYQVEVDYLRQHEWAKNSDDILWRRTKLGLGLTPSSQKALTDYLLLK